jgi:hypothetical protein
MALRHLSLALQPAYGSQVIATDADLAPLEDDENFRKIKKGILEIIKGQQEK